MVLLSVRLLPEEGTLASGQGLAAVSVDFVGSGNDPLKGKEKATSRGESGGFAQRADAPAGCTRFLHGTFRRVHWGIFTCLVSWTRIHYCGLVGRGSGRGLPSVVGAFDPCCRAEADIHSLAPPGCAVHAPVAGVNRDQSPDHARAKRAMHMVLGYAQPAEPRESAH